MAGWMAAPAPGTVVLFLGSDPETEHRVGALPGTVSWLARTVFPANVFLGPPFRSSKSSEDEIGPFPADQVMCAQRVLDQAKKVGRTVQFVDVNRPGEARELVLRFMGPGDVLPVLLRQDGARLAGAESFDGRTIREFLTRS